MSTQLEYNGVRIRNCTVRDWRQKAEYDESGTDVVLNRFRVRVNGYIYLHALATAAINVNEDGASVPKPQVTVPRLQNDAVGIYNLARKLLMEPRKTLLVTFNGRTVLSCRPTTTNVDVKSGLGDVDNGPKPRDLDIVKVVGKKSIRVEFEIECALVECDDNTNTAGVLSNRWSTEEDYDENFYATRTISGRLRIASQHLGALGPHSFRAWAFPPLSKGFKRQSMTFVATADQLVLEYRFVDRQIDSAPPLPGVTWSGTHSMSSADGLRTFEEVNITIHGPPGMPDKKPLISIAADLVQAKLGILNRIQGTDYWPHQVSIIDHMETAEIEVRFRIEQIGDSAIAAWGFGGQQLGIWPRVFNQGAYDRLNSAQPTDFGVNTPGGILVCFLQTQCDNDHLMPQTGERDTKKPKKADREETSVATYIGGTGTLTTDTALRSRYSADHRKAMFTTYEMTATYLTTHNRVQLPIASSTSSKSKQTAAIVALARPTSKVVVQIKAERVGAWPLVPSPEDILGGDGARYYLMKYTVEPLAPQLGNDGLPNHSSFTVCCRYEYALDRKAEQFDAGRSPVFSAGLFSTMIPASALRTDLFSPGNLGGASLTRR